MKKEEELTQEELQKIITLKCIVCNKRCLHTYTFCECIEECGQVNYFHLDFNSEGEHVHKGCSSKTDDEKKIKYNLIVGENKGHFWVENSGFYCDE